MNEMVNYGEFSKSYSKRICEVDNKLYIFESGRIYESVNEGMTEFSQISYSCLANSYPFSYALRRGNFV
jgi:hypothetical protein